MMSRIHRYAWFLLLRTPLRYVNQIVPKWGKWIKLAWKEGKQNIQFWENLGEKSKNWGKKPNLIIAQVYFFPKNNICTYIQYLISMHRVDFSPKRKRGLVTSRFPRRYYLQVGGNFLSKKYDSLMIAHNSCGHLSNVNLQTENFLPSLVYQ